MKESDTKSSSVGEYHPQALTESDMNLSIHLALASLPLETSQFQACAKSKSAPPSLAGLVVTYRELTHPLRSSPITGPSTLLLDDAPLCFASVLLFSWRTWRYHRC